MALFMLGPTLYIVDLSFLLLLSLILFSFISFVVLCVFLLSLVNFLSPRALSLFFLLLIGLLSLLSEILSLTMYPNNKNKIFFIYLIFL